MDNEVWLTFKLSVILLSVSSIYAIYMSWHMWRSGLDWLCLFFWLSLVSRPFWGVWCSRMFIMCRHLQTTPDLGYCTLINSTHSWMFSKELKRCFGCILSYPILKSNVSLNPFWAPQYIYIYAVQYSQTTEKPTPAFPQYLNREPHKLPRPNLHWVIPHHHCSGHTEETDWNWLKIASHASQHLQLCRQ